jgi:hypothetical protein
MHDDSFLSHGERFLSWLLDARQSHRLSVYSFADGVPSEPFDWQMPI